MLAQDSAALQLLIEVCLETEEDRRAPGGAQLLQEVRCLVCTFLHQAFIDNPMLAKLVHFQVSAADAVWRGAGLGRAGYRMVLGTGGVVW